MNKDNNFGRLLLLLLLVFGICLGLYYLPDQLFGMKIKKVDLLSDLRIKPESLSMDSLRMQLEQPDTVRIDSAAVRDSILKTTGIDSVALALRDSLYKVMYADKGADSLGTRIEDYSVGHIGLKRFFAALRNSRQANRPVRVAFLGDSFIEGDIVVADFRSGMQERFGGRGVGFVGSRPVPSDDRAKGGRLDHLVHADRSSSPVYAFRNDVRTERREAIYLDQDDRPLSGVENGFFPQILV